MSELSLEAAVAEAGDAPALISDEGTLTYRGLRDALPIRTPLILRASASPATVLALHAALRDGTTLAPLHPQATASDEARLGERLAAFAPRGVCISTSGSTGEPKLVEPPVAAWAAHARAANAHLGLDGDDRWLVSLPLSHTGGLSILVRCLMARAAVVLASAPALGPHFGPWLATVIEARGLTRLSLVPAQLDRLLADDIAPPPSLRSVLIGGQAATPSLVERALVRGWPIVTSYGLTETCGMCVASAIGERLPAGVTGRALPGVGLRLNNGLLEIHGAARAHRVLGAEAPFSDDGWLRTQDRAVISDEGLVRILGRADDVIISAGHKIDPLEVEAALCSLPTVAAAVVLGRPDPSFGARLVAFVVPARGTGLSAPAALIAAIEAGLAERLPPYKRPREILVEESLPLSANGKLDRAALARRL